MRGGEARAAEEEQRDARAARQAGAGLRGRAGDLDQAVQGGARQRERGGVRGDGDAAEQARLPGRSISTARLTASSRTSPSRRRRT